MAGVSVSTTAGRGMRPYPKPVHYAEFRHVTTMCELPFTDALQWTTNTTKVTCKNCLRIIAARKKMFRKQWYMCRCEPLVKGYRRKR